MASLNATFLSCEGQLPTATNLIPGTPVHITHLYLVLCDLSPTIILWCSPSQLSPGRTPVSCLWLAWPARWAEGILGYNKVICFQIRGISILVDSPH